MQPAGDDDWSPAVMNRPFTTGDNLWADNDGRAELHLNNAVLRMGPQTSLGFLNLDDHIAQIRFTQGELTLRVRHLDADDSFEVDTPNAAITILREGEYRFNADPDRGTTWTVVRHGEAEVTGGGQAFTLHAGNSAQLSGTDQLAYDVGSAPDPDEFEGWSEERDAREAHLQSARYLPPDVIGYEELDNYGTWRETQRLWRRLVSIGRRGMGAVPRRPLGVGGAVGLDLGGRCSVGIRAGALRPLGLCERRLGMDTRTTGDRRRTSVRL